MKVCFMQFYAANYLNKQIFLPYSSKTYLPSSASMRPQAQSPLSVSTMPTADYSPQSEVKMATASLRESTPELSTACFSSAHSSRSEASVS